MLPGMRSYAYKLCRGRHWAEDLMQETACKALGAIDRFEPGTNMTAWLFVIMRNEATSMYRKRRFEVEDVDGVESGKASTEPSQFARIHILEFFEALEKINPEQHKAIMLHRLDGMTMAETADECGVAEGTIKSRISRGQHTLAKLMQDPELLRT